MEWKNDDELFELVKKYLYTPVVGDILDELGYFHQFLPQKIQPMKEEMQIVGRAMPAILIDVFGHQEEPFGKLTQSIDQIKKNEVYVAVGGTQRCAYWGEILTATCKKNGAVGAIIDGFHRDTPKVLDQNWPVFSHGRFAQDSSARTKVVDFRCRVEVGNIVINPGDLIFGDQDGVLVIPPEVEKVVITKALVKATTENVVRKEIENGMSATDAFIKYGVL